MAMGFYGALIPRLHGRFVPAGHEYFPALGTRQARIVAYQSLGRRPTKDRTTYCISDARSVSGLASNIERLVGFWDLSVFFRVCVIHPVGFP